MKTERSTSHKRPAVDQREPDVLSEAELARVVGGYTGQIALLFMTGACMGGAIKPK
jgi:hypothetical protein